jgi:hypothetical protein
MDDSGDFERYGDVTPVIESKHQFVGFFHLPQGYLLQYSQF